MGSNLVDDELPNQLSSVDDRVAEELRQRNSLWRSNYHEASIFIEEGLNNDKFENHPRKRATKLAATNLATGGADQNQNQTTPLLSCMQHEPGHKQHSPKSGSLREANYLLGGQYTTIETYILVHNRYFYQLDLAASVILLLLALVEPPAIDGYQLNPTIHAAVEIFALGIIAIELLLKFRWMGPRRFFHHGRTVTKLIVLLTMNIEAVVILLRHTIHARYSRALRPIFLIDNHYCHGLRRAVRQIFQSLPPILDMFTLIMFFMFVFSIFGFYLFAADNANFSDMPATFGNLLILATTASLPDVMMPSYAVSRWSALFFVLFVIIHLFLFTNLTMAAVYEIFTRKEKEKFHKLLLHRRKACQEAFKLLVSRKHPNRIQYRQFMGLMRYLNRKCSMFDAYLIFKALDSDKNGSISIEEFYQIYDYINLEWRLVYPEVKWYEEYEFVPDFVKNCLNILRCIVNHRFFEWTIDFLIGAQAALQFIEATAFEFSIMPTINNQTIIAAATTNSDDIRPDRISTYVFICIFAVEAILKMTTGGIKDYWRSRWNRFDFVVLLVSVAGLMAGIFGTRPFGWVIVLRVLRLMRLFEFKRRYRDMWQTLTYILAKRFVSMTCVVMILYYFFAIVGMELLSDYDLRNCCKNTSIESQFKYDNSTDGAKYYLNDFGDVIASYLTLFSMTSSTFWLATMSAYAIVSGSNWTRIFFATFYLCSIIVMNIVIAFILESFLFHIHYRAKMGDNCDDTNLFTVFVTLSSHEVEFLRENLSSYSCARHLDKISERMNRENQYGYQQYYHDTCEEKISLLNNSGGSTKNSKSPAKRMANQQLTIERAIEKVRRPEELQARNETSVGRRTWYLIYQAEQIRNKFSFTMKMYSDEVEAWLAEAERADQDEISAMISRNQIRAEHVAMARLVRRNIADGNDISNIWPRARSYSTSGDLVSNDGRRASKGPGGSSGGVMTTSTTTTSTATTTTKTTGTRNVKDGDENRNN